MWSKRTTLAVLLDHVCCSSDASPKLQFPYFHFLCSYWPCPLLVRCLPNSFLMSFLFPFVFCVCLFFFLSYPTDDSEGDTIIHTCTFTTIHSHVLQQWRQWRLAYQQLLPIGITTLLHTRPTDSPLCTWPRQWQQRCNDNDTVRHYTHTHMAATITYNDDDGDDTISSLLPPPFSHTPTQPPPFDHHNDASLTKMMTIHCLVQYNCAHTMMMMGLQIHHHIPHVSPNFSIFRLNRSKMMMMEMSPFAIYATPIWPSHCSMYIQILQYLY